MTCLVVTNFTMTSLASDGVNETTNDLIVVSDGKTYPAKIEESIIEQENGIDKMKREVGVEIKFNESGELLNPKAKVSSYDTSYSCYATLVTHYNQYSDQTIKIYSVEGYHIVNEPTVKVYSQHVHVEYNRSAKNYYDDFYPSPMKTTWNYSVSMPRVDMYGAIYGSKYTIELGRNRAARTWNFTISDVVNNAS